jgi:hypothetical protein
LSKENIMSDQKKVSLGQRWSNLQPSKTLLVWSCAGSVAAALVVGFVWGGWVTGGTARSMAETAGDQGRYELASVICVEKFLAAPDAQAQLVDFQAIDSAYRQREFIEVGGWAVMPNADKATRQSADLCAKVLAALEPRDVIPVTEAAAEEPAAVAQ